MKRPKTPEEWEALLRSENLAPLDQPQTKADRRMGRQRMTDTCLLDPERATEYEASLAYYDDAREFTSSIPDAEDRAVWAAHAEGMSGSEIIEHLALNVTTTRAVELRIARLRKQMRAH